MEYIVGFALLAVMFLWIAVIDRPEDNYPQVCQIPAVRRPSPDEVAAIGTEQEHTVAWNGTSWEWVETGLDTHGAPMWNKGTTNEKSTDD